MSNGYETDLAWRPLPGWQVIGGFSQFKFRRNSEIEQVVVIPNRLAPDFQSRATLWTKYDFREGDLKNLGLGFGVIHEGERFGEADRRFTVPGYTVCNGLVTYRWGRFKAAVNIENLFDQRYVLRIEEARTYNPGAPRALKFSLTATY
jgi:iron complex outermembrane receptor protein